MDSRHRRRGRHISVVIARDDGDVARPAKTVEPGAGARIFVRQRQVDEIAGYRDVVGAALLNVGGDRLQNVRAMNEFTLALPIDEAESALAKKLRGLWRQGHVQIGQVGQNEHRLREYGDDPSSQRVHNKSERPIDPPVTAANLGGAQHAVDRRRDRRLSLIAGAGILLFTHELPITMPAANTKTPPTTTWKAACRNGVSMYR